MSIIAGLVCWWLLGAYFVHRTGGLDVWRTLGDGRYPVWTRLLDNLIALPFLLTVAAVLLLWLFLN